MAINSSIQTLINSNRVLSSETDINNLFYYYYGRVPTTAEKTYWKTKTSSQLANALTPNAAQFKTAGYYKDVLTTPAAPAAPAAPSAPAAPAAPSAPSAPAAPKTATSTDLNTTPLGNSGVQSLFKLYYGRNATVEELSYWSTKSDADLRPKLIPNSATELAKRKQEQAAASGTTNNDQTNKATDQNKTGDGLVDTVEEQNNYILDGNQFLIKFSDDPTPNDGIDDTNTIWLYDKDGKTYTPFTSMGALTSYFGSTEKANAATQRMITLPSSQMSNSAWSGKFVSRKYGVQSDGSMPSVPENGYVITNITTDEDTTNADSSTTARYGKDYDATATSNMTKFIGKAFTTLHNNGKISDATLEALKTDKDDILTKYVNACLYGGYTLQDVYADTKAKELSAAGNTAYANYKTFDETVAAAEWYKTAEGTKAKNDNSLKVDLEGTGMDSQLFDSFVYDISPDAFSTLVEPIDWNSDEFKAEAEKIQAGWYDILQQQAEATTEQEYKVAKDNWDIFRNKLEKQYGLQLSDNARTAWNQFTQITEGMNSKGLAQSGLLEEANDKMLTDMRRSNDTLRTDKTTAEETEQRNYLLNNATAEEVKSFVASDPTKAAKWGIIPSSDIANYFTLSNLKTVYPALSDAELQAVRDSMIDENGNYRSTLYKTLYTNKYNINSDKTTYQQQKLYDQKLEAEKKAYAPWETSNPFSSYNPDYANADKAVESPASNWTLPSVDSVNNTAPSSSSNSNLWSINPANKLNTTSSLSGTATDTTDRIKIPNLTIMNTYKPTDYDRIGTDVYLKKGVKSTW